MAAAAGAERPSAREVSGYPQVNWLRTSGACCAARVWTMRLVSPEPRWRGAWTRWDGGEGSRWRFRSFTQCARRPRRARGHGGAARKGFLASEISPSKEPMDQDSLLPSLLYCAPN